MLKSIPLGVIAVAVGAAVAACGTTHERATTPVPGVPDSRLWIASRRDDQSSSPRGGFR
jgi:hypothetical protein